MEGRGGDRGNRGSSDTEKGEAEGGVEKGGSTGETKGKGDGSRQTEGWESERVRNMGRGDGGREKDRGI